MNIWATFGVSVVTALLTGGAAVAGIKAWSTRRNRRADATATVSVATATFSGEALKWVQEFQEETASARREASEARAEAAQDAAAARRELDSMRQEVAAARREVAQVRDEAERALRSIRLLVMSPTATLDQIREHVTGPGWLNGR